jgi:hypothetical protein
MTPASIIQIGPAWFLALTLLHTFSSKAFQRFKHPALHLLSEVEFIFAFWGALYLGFRALMSTENTFLPWLTGLSFSEPLFVFAIMLAAATTPILNLSEILIRRTAQLLPFPKHLKATKVPLTFGILTLGPLLGSLITEPAAMTVSALLIRGRILGPTSSRKLLYSMIATLFVNVSIGGVLTSFAAPPVLMVAHAWNWDTFWMLATFGLRACPAVILNAAFVLLLNFKELKDYAPSQNGPLPTSPIPVSFLNLALIGILIFASHSPLLLLVGFAMMITFFRLTQKHQGALDFKPGLLVGGFLAGLTLLTADQGWWISPLLTTFTDGSLYLGAITLTAFTDNAALTSLATRAPGLSAHAQYLIVAGAVVGGGLTLVANAPNPVGFSILKTRFGKDGLSPFTLIAHALLPTLIAGALLWKPS